MSIVPVNFSDSQHKAIIMKLCGRNKFYEGDVYFEIYRDVPENLKNMLSVEEYDRVKKNLLEGCNKAISRGYFIIDKEKGKNSVVGFLIYNIEKQISVSSLLFILVDKKYQNQSFGTTLMNKYMEDIRDLNILMARVKSENGLNEWYNKFHFKKHDSFHNTSSEYEVLHYFRSEV
jgi:ribosomal protein S18 acetylase RimI-like enzyme